MTDDTTDHPDTSIGYEGRAKVEARLRQLEGGDGAVILANKDGKLSAAKTAKYDATAAKSSAVAPAYNESSDMQMDLEEPSKKKSKKEKKSKKRKAEEPEQEEANGKSEDGEPSKKKSKKEKKEKSKKKKKSKD